MAIEKLIRREGAESNKKLTKTYNKIQQLIEALTKKNVPSNELAFINERIQLINSFDGTDKELARTLKSSYSKVLTFIEEKLQFVAKNHYRMRWMGYGMLAGIVFSSTFSSLDFMGIGGSAGIGLSIGMLIGIVVGTNMDDQAEKQGRKLNLVS
jgi:hypothetical protein